VKFALPPTPHPSVSIATSEQRFAVRRIFCVGQNYLAHVLEMGGDPGQSPVFFTKPADAVVDSSGSVPPMATENLHHEAELVVAIGVGGVNIDVDAALAHVWGYATGIDLTRRDLQSAAKNAGMPWDMAKGFDNSAPCGALHPAADIGHPVAGRIALAVNGETRQNSDISDMIWSVPAIIAALSEFVALSPGDLIYTGTPSGVGPLVAGDSVTVEIDGLSSLSVTIG